MPKKRYRWDDLLDMQEEDCPSGVVAFLIDAPMTAKDVSLPKALCLSVLLELDTGTTPECLTASQVLWEPDADTLPDNILEPVAETTPEVFSASQSLLEPEADKLKIELHELKVILSI